VVDRARGLPRHAAVGRAREPGVGEVAHRVLVGRSRRALARRHDPLPRGVDEVRIARVGGEGLLVVEVVAQRARVVEADLARGAPRGAVVVRERREDRVARRRIVERERDRVHAPRRPVRHPRIGRPLVVARPRRQRRPLHGAGRRAAGAAREARRAVRPGGAAVGRVREQVAVRAAVVPAVLLPAADHRRGVGRVVRDVRFDLGVLIDDAARERLARSAGNRARPAVIVETSGAGSGRGGLDRADGQVVMRPARASLARAARRARRSRRRLAAGAAAARGPWHRRRCDRRS
jgi:hypothetical protein